MIVKDYKPIGHIDFIDGTRVPVVKEFETKNTSTRKVVNFVAVDGEMYQLDQNKNKHDPSNCICRFLKFNDKQCYFEPTDTIKEIEIYSPKPALQWNITYPTMWVPNSKYENLKKDYTILANALNKLKEYFTCVTLSTLVDCEIEGVRIPQHYSYYIAKTLTRKIDDQDTVTLLKEAFNIAEKDDTPEHTLRRMCYNIYNYNVLQKKYDVLLEENKKVKEDIKDLANQHKILTQQYKTLREKHDAVRKERYELLQFKNKNWWIAEYAEQCPGSVSLIEANNKLKKANEELQLHYNAVSGENEELKKEVSALQQENSALVTSRNLYKSSKGMIEFSLSGQIAGLRLANDRLEAELTIAKNANHAIKEKCVKLEKQNKRYAEALNIIDDNLGWSPRHDNEGAPYYYASSLILAKDINKIKQTMQEVKSENNN